MNRRENKSFGGDTVPKAKRSLGQNFLVDRSVVSRIVGAFAPRADDVVLEIGPGHGALTERLVGSVGKLYALEFDSALAPLLREKLSGHANFEVIEGDAMEFDYARLISDENRLRLIANLPYNIATPVLQRLFHYPDVFSDCVLMFQKEVVERITAIPGTRDRGYLSVMTQVNFGVEHLFDIPPGAFRPIPKVWSSVVRLISTPKLEMPAGFSRLVAAGFSQKRKTIGNNLKTMFQNYQRALESAGVDPQRRAETLTIDEWLRLSEAISSEI